ncbi:hypothetical protein MAPG_10752 [Magnaporthiopsis poae ATCC 64411]|uniref:Uncharacterized protein n=1 Tax=Magnaporthiopsis poae (strain ATCC 64411 / 73-15) TaxID=644358 RepID=A0A0C4EDF4_MAGP6|nr:hypothetical protein MAPG_10752 [Magnaporthiopsis poae ATCC 64411]
MLVEVHGCRCWGMHNEDQNDCLTRRFTKPFPLCSAKSDTYLGRGAKRNDQVRWADADSEARRASHLQPGDSTSQCRGRGTTPSATVSSSARDGGGGADPLGEGRRTGLKTQLPAAMLDVYNKITSITVFNGSFVPAGDYQARGGRGAKAAPRRHRSLILNDTADTGANRAGNKGAG